VLIHRSGKVEKLIVGDFNGIMIPQLGNIRTAGGRLKGLRLVHTHLAGEKISDENLELHLSGEVTLKVGKRRFLKLQF